MMHGQIKIKKEHFIKKKHYYMAVFLDFLVLPFVKLMKDCDRSSIDPDSIVLFGHRHLGDILLSTPLLAALRSRFPKTRICVLCPEKLSGILDNNPNVNDIIFVDDFSSNILIRFFEILKVIIRIRKERFDLGISYNNNGYPLYHFILFLSGVKRRIGYAHKGLSFLINDIVPFQGPKLVIEERLDFARHLGMSVEFSVPHIFLNDSEIHEAEAIVENLGLRPGVPIIGISPHAEHLFLWNNSDWAELCRKFRTEYNAEILFIGSLASCEIIEAIQKELDFRIYTLAGRTTVRQAAAVIRNLSLLVGLDTGTRHMAAAQDIPAVFLRNGCEHDEELGSYGHNHFMVINEMPCAPCGDVVCKVGTYSCVRDITVEAVFDMIKNNVGSWMPRPSRNKVI